MSDDQGLPVIYEIFQDWNTLEDKMLDTRTQIQV